MKLEEWACVFDCEGDPLVGILHTAPQDADRIGVLVVVGGPQYRVGSHRQFVVMARSLAARGYSVLRFDYRGMGDSGGAPRSFASVDADIRAALDHWARLDPTLRGFVIWGLCDAASAAFMYGHTDRRVLGLIVANPWVRSEASEARAYVRHYYGRRLLQGDFWRKLFSGRVSLRASASDLAGKLARTLGYGGCAATDVATADFRARMLSGLTSFAGPVLLLLSGRDLTAREFEDFSAAATDWRRALASTMVETLRLADADHTLSDRASQNAASLATLEWIARAIRCEQ